MQECAIRELQVWNDMSRTNVNNGSDALPRKNVAYMLPSST